MNFYAHLHALKIDREGEVTLTLKVPASDLGKVVPLAEQTETVFLVSIEQT